MTINGIDFGPIVTVLPESGAFAVAHRPTTKQDSRLLGRRRVMMRGGGVMLEARQENAHTLGEFLESAFFRLGTEPLFVAISVAGDTKESRAEEWRTAAELVSIAAANRTQAGFGVIVEVSDAVSDRSEEIQEAAVGFHRIGIPVALRMSVLTAPDRAADMADSDSCDAVFVASGVPWSSLSAEAQRVFFRRKASPFPASENGGMVFGKYIAPLAAEWVRQIRRHGMQKPVVSGGVITPAELDALASSGVTALSKDSVASRLRPWNAWFIFRKARTLFR